MSEESILTTLPQKKSPIVKKPRHQYIRELAEKIYTEAVEQKTIELYDLILDIQQAKDQTFSIRDAGENYKKACHQIADMSIVAAASFYDTWKVKKGKYID